MTVFEVAVKIDVVVTDRATAAVIASEPIL
jgi:hypothetical protein